MRFFIPTLIFVLTLSILFSGCGPQKGNTYEEKLTGKRVKVEEIDDCGDISMSYKTIDATFGEGKGKTCVKFVEDLGNTLAWTVETIDDFENKYKKVE